MGRSLSTIYNQLTASKETNTDLDTLLPNPDNWAALYTYENFKLLANTITKSLSVSKVAIWRLVMDAVAYAIWLQESLYDTFVSEVDDAIENREYGQLPWYAKVSKEFQYGDALEWLDNSYYGYSVLDDTKQIVTQAAATVTNGAILLKVAQGVVGSLAKLTTAQLNAFQQYMVGSNQPYAEDCIAPAGTQITIISEDPDNLRFSCTVFYNSQIINSDGELLSDTSIKPVETAVTNYIQQIPFNSKFTIAGLVDAIQAAQGVENITIDNCDAKTDTQAWSAATDVLLEVGKQYVARAGYMAMGTNYELDGYYDYPIRRISTITYIAE